MLSFPHAHFARAFNMQYAIGAFNASNLETAQAIIAAAAAAKAPVIVQTSEGAIDYAGLEVIVNLVKDLANNTDVPVILHLDHGHSLQRVQQCIEAGYTSVMIDASTKRLSENIAVTTSVVKYAHDRGVWVEGELGAILGAEGRQSLAGQPPPLASLTDPAEALQFARQTGVDALAVAIGTIHGAFTGQEYIRFELLEALQTALPDLPLVVHGASGIAADHLRQVATSNVCKINVDTELRLAFAKAVKAYLAAPPDKLDLRDMLGDARDAAQAVVAEKIDIFGSNGKAGVK